MADRDPRLFEAGVPWVSVPSPPMPEGFTDRAAWDAIHWRFGYRGSVLDAAVIAWQRANQGRVRAAANATGREWLAGLPRYEVSVLIGPCSKEEAARAMVAAHEAADRVVPGAGTALNYWDEENNCPGGDPVDDIDVIGTTKARGQC